MVSPRRTTLRVRHTVREQKQSRHELHPTVEMSKATWKEGAFYAVCGNIQTCPVVVGMLVCGYQKVDELGQEEVLCCDLPEKRRPHKTRGCRSASDKCSPTLDTLRRGQMWLA